MRLEFFTSNAILAGMLKQDTHIFALQLRKLLYYIWLHPLGVLDNLPQFFGPVRELARCPICTPTGSAEVRADARLVHHHVWSFLPFCADSASALPWDRSRVATCGIRWRRVYVLACTVVNTACIMIDAA